MEIDFDNPRHEALVNDFDALCKIYNKKGQNCAEDIINTINVLNAADSLFDVPHSYHPHPLQGSYKVFFAVNVTDKHRIIFKPNHDGDSNFRIDNYKSITAISIIEIFENYH